MDTSIIQNEYVYTQKANCVDCYRCLKSCPVKAIKVKKGQAYILGERCIDCNICAQNCAQKAISYKNDKSKFYDLLKTGRKMVVSVAPSYASICADWERARFPSALRKLGFSFASGASVGANIVVVEMMKIIKANPDKSFITSICPSVVNYVEMYHSDLIDKLIPIVSPYIAHAK
jgi:iron only hydrogenase large subunit-like protein